MLDDADALIAIDTSLAVPLLIQNHEAHRRCIEWRSERNLALSGHAWIETYAVLTRLPGSARVAPDDAARLLSSNFSEPLAVGPEVLMAAVERFAAAGISGGATYDGWVALAAFEHGAKLASRDTRAEATYRRLGIDVELVA